MPTYTESEPEVGSQKRERDLKTEVGEERWLRILFFLVCFFFLKKSSCGGCLMAKALSMQLRGCEFKSLKLM